MKIRDFQDAENAKHFLAWQDSTAEHYIRRRQNEI